MKSPVGLLKAGIFVTTAAAIFGFNTAFAQNLIVNGSFENTSATFVDSGGGYMALTTGSTVIPGWTITNDQITWLLSGSQPYGSTPFGTFFLDLTGTHDNGSYAGVAQTITTIPSQNYTLSVSIGVNQNDAGGSGSKSVLAAAGSTNKSLAFTPSGTGMQWTNLSFNFVATSASTLISIAGTSSGAGVQSLFFDNVSVIINAPALTIVPAVAKQETISWTPATPGYVLQESTNLASGSWTDSPSGATNPITISASSPARFYRLFHP
jgi:hypothetical protein